MQRLIRKEIEDPLAIEPLEGRFGKRNSVTVDVAGDRRVLQ